MRAEICLERGEIVMSYKLSIYHYCIDCGNKFDIPSRYASCKKCRVNYMNGRIQYNCRKCSKPKKSKEYGLCLDCYNEIMSLNIAALGC